MDMHSPEIRIFISHSHADNDLGIRLKQDLCRSLGDDTAVWYDADGGLHAGDIWWDEIVKEITARPILMLLVSAQAMQSSWVRNEFRLAIQLHKYIVPILLESCQDQIWKDLQSYHFLKLLPTTSYVEGLRNIQATLEHIQEKFTPAIKPSHKNSSNSRYKRLKQEHIDLQKQYDEQATKVRELRSKLQNQGAGSYYYQLKHDLESEKAKLVSLETELDTLEQKLATYEEA
jgi:TIR domain